jgi:hypothetical protein
VTTGFALMHIGIYMYVRTIQATLSESLMSNWLLIVKRFAVASITIKPPLSHGKESVDAT